MKPPGMENWNSAAAADPETQRSFVQKQLPE
jgi:hypothetical protein